MAEAFEPLYSAAEMRAAEERYPRLPGVDPGADGARGSGRRARGDARLPGGDDASPCVCGGGSNGGDGRVAARVLRESGHVADETDEDLDRYDVVVDALFGTGFRGAPRPEAAELIGRMNAARRPSSRSTCPPASTPRRARSRTLAVEADLTVTFHAREGGSRRRAGPVQRRAGRRRRHRARRRAARRCAARRRRSSTRSPVVALATRSTRPAPCSSSAGSRGRQAPRA